jgi:hypothetical protein
VVVIERNALDGVERVCVEDDGHGMAPEAIPSAFQNLGGSWKATAKLSPNIQRPMTGRDGQGRVCGFALRRYRWQFGRAAGPGADVSPNRSSRKPCRTSDGARAGHYPRDASPPPSA